MKLRRTLLPLVAFFLLVLGALSFVEVAQGSQDKLESLSAERTGTIFLRAKCWDLILGARARLIFLYIDDVLVKASISSGKTPDWLSGISVISKSRDRGQRTVRAAIRGL